MSKVVRLAKTTGGLPPSRLKQLYNTVAIPAITYAADIWYIGLHRPNIDGKTLGSVGATNKLKSIQCRAAKYITGALSTTAGDIMDIHTHILPVNLLFPKVLFRSAACIASLPRTHPLFSIAQQTARQYVRHHHSPLHYLFHITQVRPEEVETITPIHRQPNYRPSFSVQIATSKDEALTAAEILEETLPIWIYCDGSGIEGSIGAAAVLYISDKIEEVMYYHLGLALKHSVRS